MAMRLVTTSVLMASAAAELVKLGNADGEKAFDEVVGKGKPVLVKFFAPWCGFCVRMAEGYEAAANNLEGHVDAVVAEINCDEASNQAIMSKYGVQGFPTLIWFDAEGNQQDYNSGRDQTSITNFVLENSKASNSYGKYIVQAKDMARNVNEIVAYNVGEFWETYVPEFKLPAVTKTFPNFGGNKDADNGVDHGNSDLLTLVPDNLEDIIARGNVLVKFFAPWCGHCKAMKEDYEQVAQKIHADHKSVTVAEFDCTQDGASDLSQKYSPDGFPTVMWFPASGDAWEYNGGRDQDSIQNFVREHAGPADPLKAVKDAVWNGLMKANDVGLVVREHVENAASKALAIALGKKTPIVATGENINRIVEAKNALVKFYAPWCGFCKRLAPEYEAAAIELHAKYPNVQIVDFDCDEPTHGRMKCGEFGVQGYPTLKWFDASGETIEYDGGRDKNAIVEWVSAKMDAAKKDEL